MPGKSGCEKSDNDSGIGKSIRNDDAYPPLSLRMDHHQDGWIDRWIDGWMAVSTAVRTYVRR